MAIGHSLPFTHLSLLEFGRIAGINPAHLMGGATSSVMPIYNNACSELIAHYSWQDEDAVSHEEILIEIEQAERDIADFLGYWVAPQWTSQEIRQITRPYRPDYFRRYMRDVRGMPIGINLEKGKVIQAGQRAVSLVGTATVAGATLVYSDEDGDGFEETATIALASALTNVCECKVYYPGMSGDQRYEIRPVRSASLAGGTLTIVLDVWQMIDLDTLEALPDLEGWQGIDISLSANLLQTVDVYREYNNATSASAVFYWEPTPRMLDVICASCGGTGCPACTYTTQNGCLLPRDPEEGIAIVTPATYDADNAQWNKSAFTVNRDPDFVKVYYYSGNVSQRGLSGGCDTLDPRLARAIAQMVLARLDRPICDCANPTALWKKFSQDLAFAGAAGSYNVSFEDLANPFGTRLGEVAAWRAIAKTSMPRRAVKVALL